MVIQARLQSFPRIYMCLCHLCQKWHKWHNVVNVYNSARKCVNATITIEEHAFRYEVDFPETIISVSIQFQRLRI